MHSMVSIVNNNVYLKVAKRVDLQSPLNIEPLCRTPETNIMYGSCIPIKKRLKEKKKRFLTQIGTVEFPHFGLMALTVDDILVLSSRESPA